MIPDHIQASLIDLAHQFRMGLNLQASLALPDILQSIYEQMPFLSSEVQVAFDRIVGLVLQAQQAHDWLGLADYLEYDMTELFQ